MSSSTTISPAPVDPVTRAWPYLTFFLTGVVTTVLGPILPWATARWGLGDAEAGAFFAVQFTCSLAAGFASGLVASRFGDRPTITLGLTSMGMGTIAVAAGPVGVAYTGIGLCGTGIGLAVPTTNMLVARTHRSSASAAVSALNLAWGAGAAVWPLMLALFRDGVPALSLLAVIVFAVAALGIRARISDVAVPPATEAGLRTGRAQWAFFGLFFFIYGGSEAAVGGWVTELARRLSPAAPAAMAAAAFWGGLTAGRAAVAMMVGENRESRAAMGGLALATLAVSALLAAGDASTAAVLAAVAGVGLAPLFPITVAVLARGRAGDAAGPLISMAGVGGAILPWLVGYLSSRAGSLQIGLLVPLAGCAAMLLLHGTFWMRHRPPNAL